ncbi:MAG: hypothetical protein DRJ69_03460, partial [Thermoprotei archaeon]
MVKVFVTGCAGFIGSWVVGNSLSKGFKVVGADCFTPYYSLRLKQYNIRDVTVAVPGLTYKPGTDDIRESQSIKLVKKLVELGVNVKVH